MSSRSPRRSALAALAGALALAAAVAQAAPKEPPAPAPRATVPERTRASLNETRQPELPPGYDDSTAAAHRLLLLLRPLYGGIDGWARIGGARYYVTYRIPGPDSTTVRQWTESHIVWLHDRPRMRIDNSDDSTVVVVTGDSTFVRRAGEWVTDPAVVGPARAQALDEVWLLRMPWNLLDARLKRRLNRDWAQNQPLDVRVEYGPGLDRPAGTRLFLRYDPPTYALRTMRWYDPQSRNWYLMEFSDDGRRYGWTWSNRRVLRTTDADGTPGPVVLTAQLQDMQIETFLPTEVLAPPGGTATVSRADSAATGSLPGAPPPGAGASAGAAGR